MLHSEFKVREDKLSMLHSEFKVREDKLSMLHSDKYYLEKM